jgi:plasmid stabilization system protein ParE
MKLVFTDEALADLDGILAFIASNYPTIYGAFQNRLQSVLARIGDWPESAQEVADRPGIAPAAK